MYPMLMKPIRYVRQSNFLLPFPLFKKADVNSFMIYRKSKVLLRRKKILYTQGKFSENSFLISQQHIVVSCLYNWGQGGQTLLRHSPDPSIYFWVFIAINIFYCVTSTINYPTDVVLNLMVCHSILILEAFWWLHFCVSSLTKPYQKQIGSTL